MSATIKVIILLCISALSAYCQNLKSAKEAQPDQFPYLAYLTSTVFPYSITSNCVGSLISENFVLTAASCVLQKKIEKLENGTMKEYDDQYQWVWETYVLLGAFNPSDSNEISQKEIYVPPSNFIVHNEYHPSHQKNDIALLQLPEKVEFNEHIRTINLPSRSLADLLDKTVLHAGWGIVNLNSKDKPFALRFTHYKVIDHKICQASYKNNEISKDLQICANGFKGRRKVCGGESGSALVLEENNEKIQVGVSVFGFDCDKNQPYVFTRISAYLDWISEKTELLIRD